MVGDSVENSLKVAGDGVAATAMVTSPIWFQHTLQYFTIYGNAALVLLGFLIGYLRLKHELDERKKKK